MILLCGFCLRKVQQKSLRGTTGEILATPSIEHNGLRGENRFLNEARRQQRSTSQLFSSCVWQTSAWARCAHITKHNGDGDNQNGAAVVGECTLLHPAPCANQRNLLWEPKL